MALELTFTCPLQNGMHARPASALEEIARGFISDITLLNRRTGRNANARSILSIVGADIRCGDSCVLTVSGTDEELAMAALGDFVRHTLPRRETQISEQKTNVAERFLPRCLRDTGATLRRGVPLVEGIGRGRLVRVSGLRMPQELAKTGVADVAGEQERIRRALAELIEWYGSRAAIAERGVERDVLIAHRSLARDEEFQSCLFNAVQAGRTAAGAIVMAEEQFTGLLALSANPLLRERVIDIRDVCGQLLQRVYGNLPDRILALREDSIVMADWLTPCQILSLDERFLKGLVLSEAGSTSHTIILARSFGIPTLAGVEETLAIPEGDEAVLDGDSGVLVTNLTEQARRYYALEQQRQQGRAAVLSKYANSPAATRDGHRIEIAANAGTVEEVAKAFTAGAEVIGLFRTEMLFLDRSTAPSEVEQYEIYRKVLEAARGRTVIFRTIDIGGDKPLGYLNLLPESNPFLGCRGIRIYPEFEVLIRNQLRALLRASAHGPMKIMFPMIATVDEARWINRLVTEERKRCSDEGKCFDAKLSLGAMIEVPSAAFVLKELCAEFDFFSIGSNDLLQYTMAADRTNSRVATLYDPCHPAFLRLIRQIVATVRRAGKWIGLCGEMGADERLLPLWVGMGFYEISATAPAIARMKAAVAQLNYSDCSRLCDKAVRCADSDALKSVLGRHLERRGLPVIAPELVATDFDASNKEEAIKRAVDQLYVHGRCNQPRLLEDDVWKRESHYTTGFGNGFALPHCRTNHVTASSIVVLKLRSPVPWDAADNVPVKVVILLAIREGGSMNEHMKMISQLARQLMHEPFRDSLEREQNPEALCRLLMEVSE